MPSSQQSSRFTSDRLEQAVGLSGTPLLLAAGPRPVARSRPARREKAKSPASPPVYPAGLLVAYTDGTTYKTNPGPVAWAVVYLRNAQVERTETGALYTGTNNRAELLAAIWALERAPAEDLLIVSDSLYVINHALGRWSVHANHDLWARFRQALAIRDRRGLKTSFQHVHGHRHDPYNNLADELARAIAHHAAACLEETGLCP